MINDSVNPILFFINRYSTKQQRHNQDASQIGKGSLNLRLTKKFNF